MPREVFECIVLFLTKKLSPVRGRCWENEDSLSSRSSTVSRFVMRVRFKGIPSDISNLKNEKRGFGGSVDFFSEPKALSSFSELIILDFL